MLDISEEVGNWGDHGLLGFTLDPNFLNNGYLYLLYVVDRHYLLHFGTPTYDAGTNEYSDATIGRVTRYTANASDGFETVNPTTRHILVGDTPQNGIPILYSTHGVGTILFGTDGTLIISTGDGAYLGDRGGPGNPSYSEQGLIDGIIKPKEDVGAFRSQGAGGRLVDWDDFEY